MLIIQVLYYLAKLRSLPIQVKHLEETGIGRFVNKLKLIPGEVGSRAGYLVENWRKIVSAEEQEDISKHASPPAAQPEEDSYVSAVDTLLSGAYGYSYLY